MADWSPYRIVIMPATDPIFPFRWFAAENLHPPGWKPGDPPRLHPGSRPYDEDESGLWATIDDGYGESIETCRRSARSACDRHLDAHRTLEAPIVESYTPAQEPQ